MRMGPVHTLTTPLAEERGTQLLIEFVRPAQLKFWRRLLLLLLFLLLGGSSGSGGCGCIMPEGARRAPAAATRGEEATVLPCCVRGQVGLAGRYLHIDTIAAAVLQPGAL